jgi:hypothetical protein
MTRADTTLRWRPQSSKVPSRPEMTTVGPTRHDMTILDLALGMASSMAPSELEGFLMEVEAHGRGAEPVGQLPALHHHRPGNMEGGGSREMMSRTFLLHFFEPIAIGLPLDRYIAGPLPMTSRGPAYLGPQARTGTLLSPRALAASMVSLNSSSSLGRPLLPSQTRMEPSVREGISCTPSPRWILLAENGASVINARDPKQLWNAPRQRVAFDLAGCAHAINPRIVALYKLRYSLRMVVRIRLIAGALYAHRGGCPPTRIFEGHSAAEALSLISLNHIGSSMQ